MSGGVGGEAGTNEFLDARPSEEDEAAPAEAEAGGDDDMVFLDEAVEAPAKGPPRGAPKGPPPKGAPKAPPPKGGPGASGAAPRPAPGSPPAGTDRPPSGAHRPPSGVGLKGGAPASGATPRPPSGPLPRQASPDDKRLSASSSGRFKALSASTAAAPTTAGTSSSSRLQRPAQRPERSREEDQRAITELEARVRPAPQGDPFVGKDVGPFRVDSFLEVDRGERRYAAIHTETQRIVVLRVFPLGGSFGEEFKRVAERGERACRVESPNLDVAVAAGRTKDAFYAGFDPPLGPTLAEVLGAGPLEEADLLALLEQAGRALGALHVRDLAHGHLAPEAIRRPRPGTWIVEGAGLARPRPALSFLAAGGDVLGRPGFIAPETVDGGESTRAADLYALGCVAWTCLCGRPPFAGDDEVQVLLDQLNREVPPLALPAGRAVTEPVQAIVKKLTGYVPDVRYKEAKDLVADLRARERGEAITPFQAFARASDAPREVKKLRGAGPALLGLLALNVVLLVVIAATAFKASRVAFEDPTDGFVLPLPAGRSPPGR